MKEARCDNKKLTTSPISSACPSRPMGMLASMADKVLYVLRWRDTPR